MNFFGYECICNKKRKQQMQKESVNIIAFILCKHKQVKCRPPFEVSHFLVWLSFELATDHLHAFASFNSKFALRILFGKQLRQRKALTFQRFYCVYIGFTFPNEKIFCCHSKWFCFPQTKNIVKSAKRNLSKPLQSQRTFILLFL